jgi:hypothetical protein
MSANFLNEIYCCAQFKIQPWQSYLSNLRKDKINRLHFSPLLNSFLPVSQLPSGCETCSLKLIAILVYYYLDKIWQN